MAALLKDAIEQINDIKGLDFVMFTGDMVDYATEENYYNFYKLLSKMKYPSLNAFGNHDFASDVLAKEDVLDIVRGYNPNYLFEDSYYAFSPKTDYRIIVLDGVIKNQKTSNGELPAEQLQFLDNELAQNQDKIVVIMMHFAPVEPFVAREHQLLNANVFNEILLKYKNPIVVFSGHYHATKIRKFGNLIYVSTPSLVTYPMAFRHIKITNYKDRVHFDFDFIETRLDDVKEQNRQSVISYGTLAGNITDRNTQFTHYKKRHKSVRYKRNQIKKASKETKTITLKPEYLQTISEGTYTLTLVFIDGDAECSFNVAPKSDEKDTSSEKEDTVIDDDKPVSSEKEETVPDDDKPASSEKEEPTKDQDKPASNENEETTKEDDDKLASSENEDDQENDENNISNTVESNENTVSDTEETIETVEKKNGYVSQKTIIIIAVIVVAVVLVAGVIMFLVVKKAYNEEKT